MAGARNYRDLDLKRLCLLSQNECYNPECDRKLIAKDCRTITGKICHIEAASPLGPRYNPTQTDEERHSFSNLILLCDECHSIVDNKDNVSLYPVSRLQAWKKAHEEGAFQSKSREMVKSLPIVVDAIIDKVLVDNVEQGNTDVYNIESKIAFNQLNRNSFLIREYNLYSHTVDALYDELESQGSIKKSIVLMRIHSMYLLIKGEGESDADNIFDKVVEMILHTVEDSSGNYDEVLLAVFVVVVHAFVECKILEKPTHDN